MDDRLSMKEAWSRHMTNLKFLVPPKICVTDKAKDFQFYKMVANMKY